MCNDVAERYIYLEVFEQSDDVVLLLDDDLFTVDDAFLIRLNPVQSVGANLRMGHIQSGMGRIQECK